MKNIGILTHYNNSTNYGGLLQAYALCYYLNSQGYQAEQICYVLGDNSKKCVGIKSKFKKFLSDVALKERKLLFDYFRNNQIVHSNVSYTDDTLHMLNNEYRAFIVGSDQVWNSDYFHKGFFLDFADKDKLKISYAASISKTKIDKEHIDFYKKNIETFNYISVREESAKSLLKSFVNSNIETVLDPTFLLSTSQWEEIISPPIIKSKYIFYYELTHNELNRNVVAEYAKRSGLKIVTIPHVLMEFNVRDYFDRTTKVNKVGPSEFLSLIKNADYVFTDSYHACVFSGLFHTQFFVFGREGHSEMNTRIIDITKLFGCENHYIENTTIDDIISRKEIDYSSIDLTDKIQLSKSFLEKALSRLNYE
ncbi:MULTISPECIES: polysaccharide pyruvyl transferase family protein [unclassified Blautia]|uniref:polysaccharide pyruvyl transferase family protein n=1 Tax=unclassified Blautia TaxID=2648079 RepID=UPI003F8BD402